MVPSSAASPVVKQEDIVVGAQIIPSDANPSTVQSIHPWRSSRGGHHVDADQPSAEELTDPTALLAAVTEKLERAQHHLSQADADPEGAPSVQSNDATAPANEPPLSTTTGEVPNPVAPVGVIEVVLAPLLPADVPSMPASPLAAAVPAAVDSAGSALVSQADERHKHDSAGRRARQEAAAFRIAAVEARVQELDATIKKELQVSNQ